MNKLEISYDELYQQYCVENKSIADCAVFFKCSVRPIRRLISEYNLADKKIRKSKFKKDISKDELKKYYIDKDYNLVQCAEIFNCSTTTIRNNLDAFGIIKKKENITSEVIKLYKGGLSKAKIADKFNCSRSKIQRILTKNNVTLTDEEKGVRISKGIQKAIKDGTFKVPKVNFTDEVREKIRKFNQERGEELKAKREKVCIDKFGVKNVFELDEVQDRIKETNLRKYGTSSPAKNPKIAKKISESLKKTLAKKYKTDEAIAKIKEQSEKLGRQLLPEEMIKILGKSQANAYLVMHKYGIEDYIKLKGSKLEDPIEQFLKENGIEYKKHVRNIISPQELDFYIPEYNLALEVNDIYTHNSTYNSFGGEPKDKKYHYNKSKACEEKGIRLIHIWEYEWIDSKKQEIIKNIILGACNRSKSIYARKCTIEIRPSISMKDFFNENNIAGFRGGKFAICLVYEGEVVMSYMMGHAYFGKGKYEWEVIRGATKLGVRVIGGASKIWKYFIKNYNPDSVVYYVDYNYFNGTSMKSLGVKYITTKPSFKNYFVRTKQVKNRQPYRHHEIKALEEHGLVWAIWTAGVKVYVWEKPKSK